MLGWTFALVRAVRDLLAVAGGLSILVVLGRPRLRNLVLAFRVGARLMLIGRREERDSLLSVSQSALTCLSGMNAMTRHSPKYIPISRPRI